MIRKKKKITKTFKRKKKSSLTEEQSLNIAIQHHQSGNHDKARKIYQKILSTDPNNPTANHFLGLIASHEGNKNTAINLINKAISAQPDYAQAHNNLGIEYYSSNNPDKAIECYKKAIFYKPDYADAFNNLGNCLFKQGKLEESIAKYRQAIAIQPDYATALNNLANALNDQRKFNEALVCCEKVLLITPEFPEALYNLGNAYRGMGNHVEAEKCYRKAVAINKDYAQANNNLGVILCDQGKFNEAILFYKKTLAIEPDNAAAHNNIGNMYKEQGEFEKAIYHYKKALAIKPDAYSTRSNLLLSLNYCPDISQEEIYEESIKWELQQLKKNNQTNPVFTNTLDNSRKLRVGFISPDFRTHSVSYFFEPLLNGHEKDQLEIFCYSDVQKTDNVTKRLQQKADHWIPIYEKNDSDAAKLVRKDRIDILVDLTGHTAQNRLGVFLQKAAPIQVSWLGYPNTTGLHSINYRFTDDIADPVGDDNFYSETLLRLKNGFLCYLPDNKAPEVLSPPHVKKRHITFGCFNNVTKVNSEVIELWSKILSLVPDSQLLIKSRQLSIIGLKTKLLQTFKDNGISQNRLIVKQWIPEIKNHLELYNNIDISLDPFPYNGTTTTFESLWMGVPVITLLGDRHSGRVGASILHHIGKQELIASSKDAYLEKAISLAQDNDQIIYYKNTLRKSVKNSSLTDQKEFSKKMGNAFREIWSEWCRQQSQASVGNL